VKRNSNSLTNNDRISKPGKARGPVLRTVHGLLFQGLSRTAIEGQGKSGLSQTA